MALLSPLALTQTLPFLPLAQGDIDYQTERRDEPGLIPGLLNDPSTTVILVRDGLVAVPRGQGVLAARESVSMRLASLPGSYAAEALAGAPEAVAMFLGGYPGRRNAHVVAIDLTRVPMGAPSVVPDAHGIGADDAFGNAAQPNTANGRVPLFARTAERFDWVDLRGFVPHASARGGGPGHHGRGVESVARHATALPDLWCPRTDGHGRLGAAVHEPAGRASPAVPPRGAGRHRGRGGFAGPSAAAAQPGVERPDPVFGVRRIRGGGGEPGARMPA
ncbi:phosphohydrolase [Bifidobacterium pullorum]|uniref:Phosphohydrolase n=1 Tax=Bifidobacterium pullorum TaxID=78448 RepID=A0A7V8KR65_9BIFI|nr:phosphohydrolase [Bifidobacterium pullorum]